ncbi:MAG: exodeoxyribonuclease VII large subunit [Kiritimatiellae bacterium]|nr:exodeoxyribonuclease VII large subunit [Kiritimatiellia bacterium]
MTETSQLRDQRKVYRVSEINRLARVTLENEFGDVWIEGELSGVRTSQPGHIYFSLKDEHAVISAAFFHRDQRGLTFELKDGLKVQAFGRLTIYDANGRYQIVVRKIEEVGKGSLQEAFEKLKAKLKAEGLFDEARKKPLPVLPRHVGIVTSPTGAALRDILNVLGRRFPNLHIVISPARVQGAGAAQEVADAIDLLDRHGGVDVMIVGRGGGSLEDLWCFNEEIVARAIARARTPIISAVGHETDFTISDFVADLRAPTPSAAAELVVGQKEAFEEQLRQLARLVARALQTRELQLRNRLTAAARSYVFREPQNLVRQYRERLKGLRTRVVHESRNLLNRQQQRTDELSVKLGHEVQVRLAESSQDLRRLSSQLRALGPQAVLDRGYSITRRADGAVVRAAADVRKGDSLKTQLARGVIESEVTDAEDGSAGT